jgi:hypothetical protein
MDVLVMADVLTDTRLNVDDLLQFLDEQKNGVEYHFVPYLVNSMVNAEGCKLTPRTVLTVRRRTNSPVVKRLSPLCNHLRQICLKRDESACFKLLAKIHACSVREVKLSDHVLDTVSEAGVHARYIVRLLRSERFCFF